MARPVTPENKKIKRGLYPEQWDRIKLDAEKRGIPVNQMLRHIVGWYYSAVDSNEYHPTGEEDSDFENLVNENQN